MIPAISARDRLAEALRRVEPGADRGAALRELVEAGQRQLDPLAPSGHLPRIAGEFLAQRQRGGVLRVGAADLDDVVPGLGLGRAARRAIAASAGSSRPRHLPSPRRC